MISRITPLCMLMILCFSYNTYCQSDSTLVQEEKSNWLPSGYIAGVYENSSVSPVRTPSFGVQAALLIKGHWQLGLYATRYSANNYQEQLIFPNYAQMNYKHGGMVLGYRTQLQKKYEFSLETKLGLGETKWQHVDSGNAFLADKFRAMQVQICLDYMVANFLAFSPNLGYRKVTGLDITGLESDDFNGLYYGFMIKIGRFK